jgi:hypothetical protein
MGDHPPEAVTLSATDHDRVRRCGAFGLFELRNENVTQLSECGGFGTCFVVSFAAQILESIGKMLCELVGNLTLAFGTQVKGREPAQNVL